MLNFIISNYTFYFITYWMTSALCYVCDRYLNKKYKLQNKEINLGKYHNSAKYVLYLQLISFIPTISVMYPVLYYVNIDLSWKYPGIINSLYKLILTTLIFDLLFYIGHRSLHTKLLYKYHKRHHEWTAPVGVVAHYADILEFFVVDILLAAISPVIAGCNSLLSCIWIVIASFMVIITHSGYDLFCVKSHDEHHEKFNCNYGILFTDHIFNTQYKNE